MQYFDHFKAMVRKEYLVYIRYPIQIVSTILTPIFLVLIFSFTARAFMDKPSDLELEILASFMFTGIVSYGYLEVVTSATMAIRDEQYQGTLEGLFLTPTVRILNVVARLAVRLVLVTFNMVVIYIMLKYTLSDVKINNPALSLYIFITLLLQFVGIAFLLATMTLKFKETAVVVGNFLIFMIMIFSAIFFSFSTISFPVVRDIAQFLPTSYAIDALRSTILDYPPGFPELQSIGDEILISTLSGVGMVILGVILYLRAEREARVTGTLLQY